MFSVNEVPQASHQSQIVAMGNGTDMLKVRAAISTPSDINETDSNKGTTEKGTVNKIYPLYWHVLK